MLKEQKQSTTRINIPSSFFNSHEADNKQGSTDTRRFDTTVLQLSTYMMKDRDESPYYTTPLYTILHITIPNTTLNQTIYTISCQLPNNTILYQPTV